MTNTVNCRYCKGQGTVEAEEAHQWDGVDGTISRIRAVCTNCHRASRWLDQDEWRGVGFHSGQLRAPEPAEPVVDEGPEYEGQLERPAGAVLDLGQCTACGKLIDKGLHPGGKCVQCEHPVGYHPVLGLPIQPEPAATPTDLITIKQAADLVGRHPNTISTRINLGDIKAYPPDANHRGTHPKKQQRLVSTRELLALYSIPAQLDGFGERLGAYSAKVFESLRKGTR